MKPRFHRPSHQRSNRHVQDAIHSQLIDPADDQRVLEHAPLSHELMDSEPLGQPRLDRVRALFHDYHSYQREADEGQLDGALGLPGRNVRQDPAVDTLAAQRYRTESVVNVATPYDICRGLFEAVRPSERDVFLDLGCADGRVVLYGALISPARFLGIELVAQRAEHGRRAIERLGLTNAVIAQGNVLDQSFDEVTIFYAHRPFSDETERRVVARLDEQARRRPIVVVTHRLLPSALDADALRPVTLGALCIYRSRL